MNIFKNYIHSLLKSADITINGPEPWDIQVHDKSLYTDGVLLGSLGLGDGYTNGKWDVEKIDIFIEKLITAKPVPAINIAYLGFIVRDALINTQAGKRAFHVAHKHYDLGNEMYEYMLGESMGYSCGLYLSDKDTLTDAQYNKFDALCIKLKLKPGMKVLEIGSGWGTFARHAAKNYGVEVLGLTVSEEQKIFAEKRCEGLPVEFVLLDYKKLDKSYTGYFDRVVSIEMIEAVGKKNFKDYFSTIERSMKPNGLFGLQVIIGQGIPDPFMSTRIFPNGLTPSIVQITDSIKGVLHIKSLDSFGTDYEKTLLSWEANFVKHWNKISKLKNENGEYLYDDKFYRMWRYYLLCCAATFRVGMNDDAQIIMSKIYSATLRT